MEGRTMKGLVRVLLALCTGLGVLAFALPGGAATAAGTTNDTCGYASTSFT
jgi:hypothetical protein